MFFYGLSATGPLLLACLGEFDAEVDLYLTYLLAVFDLFSIASQPRAEAAETFHFSFANSASNVFSSALNSCALNPTT